MTIKDVDMVSRCLINKGWISGSLRINCLYHETASKSWRLETNCLSRNLPVHPAEKKSISCILDIWVIKTECIYHED